MVILQHRGHNKMPLKKVPACSALGFDVLTLIFLRVSKKKIALETRSSAVSHNECMQVVTIRCRDTAPKQMHPDRCHGRPLANSVEKISVSIRGFDLKLQILNASTS